MYSNLRHLFWGSRWRRLLYQSCRGGTLAARIEGKSSFARCGLLIHFTAPTVHAGWDGPLALEMINLGAAGICLFSEMAVCQLILETVMGDPESNPSQFQGQTAPTGTA